MNENDHESHNIKDIELSNNLFYRLKKLIESFDEFIKFKKKFYKGDYFTYLNEMSFIIDMNLRRLNIPAKFYHKGGVFHLEICEIDNKE